MPQHKKQKGSEPVYELGNLALMSSAIETEAGLPEGTSKALQIAGMLQTTLEIDQLVEVFSQQIQALVPHNSASYEYKPLQISVTHGKSEKHSCSYQLVVAAQSLGQLVLTRRKKFTANETHLLEHLLCCLVYPLRNAILYRHALTAALTDPLTGVNNRTAMNSALIRETELARRHGNALSLVAADIDHFKQINDNYGHLAGDYVLKSVAEALTDCTRRTDILFRSGGEEFLILLSNTGKQGALLLAERIRTTIESSELVYGDHRIAVTASLGVACFSKGDNSESLFEKADTALYAAKSAGRNCVKFADAP
jgi:diguanylate cyclase (GGDEF)-like protein